MTMASEHIEIEVDPAERSGVAWAAIVGGALAAAAISLILMVLGTGLGFSAVSPWTSLGSNAAAIAVTSVIWLIVVQWIASAFGGYFAGRMRSRSSEPSDEVFFRDTANGFLAWALSTLLVAALLTSALSAIVGTGTQAVATVASGAAQSAMQGGVNAADPAAYFVDSLYRQPASSAAATPVVGSAQPADANEVRAETGRILANGLMAPEFPAADLDYLAERVAAATGVAPDVAKQRVADVVQKMQAAKAEAQSAADAARKGAAKLSLFMFLSLLVGAFIAAAAAALGGGHRDDRPGMIAR